MRSVLLWTAAIMAIAAANAQTVGTILRDGTNAVRVIFSNCPPCAVVQVSTNDGVSWVDLHLSKRMHATNVAVRSLAFVVPAEFSGAEYWRVRSCVSGDVN